ncbi:type IX secretion system membrane protein PorP/SprF, partial [Acinetobacter baumannii]
LGSTYNTFTAAVDGKIKSINNNDYYTSLGAVIIQDNAMDGIYKNTSANVNAAYHLTVDDKGNGLTFGLGVIYNNTKIDFSQLSFDTQLSSAGFNR